MDLNQIWRPNLFQYWKRNQMNPLQIRRKNVSSSSKDAHHPLLMQILSDDLDCKVEDIVSLELNICDTQPSCLGGANNEFIFSGRLDNLASSFCALRTLIDSCASKESLSRLNMTSG